MNVPKIYPNLEVLTDYSGPFSIEENIRLLNYQEAIKDLLFLLLDPRALPDLEKAYDHILILLPSMNQEQFDILIKRLPSFLEITASYAEQQNTLAFQLGLKFSEFSLPLEALKCFVKGIMIAEMRQDQQLCQVLHTKTSDLFLTIINCHIFPHEQFRECLVTARRKGQTELFASLLEHLKILNKLFNRQNDREVIDQRWMICRDVLHELGATGSFLPFVDLIAKQRSLEIRNLPLITERYHRYLRNIREEFSETLNPKSVRLFQSQITGKFKELCQGLISTTISIIGPPPCEYDIRSIGSISREETSPYSDLEFFIIIEDERYRKYFTTFLQIFEYQIFLFGETSEANIVFTCLGYKNKSGFHIDVGANPLKVADLFGVPEKIATLVERPITDFDDVIGDAGTQILRSQSIFNQLSSVSTQFEKMIHSAETQKFRKARALKLLKKRHLAFASVWKVESIDHVVNIKEQYLQFLTFFLSDLAIYWGIRETNTLDVIDALAALDIFTGNTAFLLKEAINFFYVLRVRMHLFYKEQKEEAYIKGLSGFIIKPEEQEQLEKIFWLILKPLYSSCLSRVIIDDEPIEKVFHQLDLVSLALEIVYQPTKPAKTYLPLITHAVKHLVSTKKPLYILLEIMKNLSRRSDLEVLRQAYANGVKESLSNQEFVKLLDIPNRSGLRLCFIHEQKMLEGLIKLATSSKNVSDVKLTCSLGKRYLSQQVASEILDEKGHIKKSYPSSAHNVTSSCGMHFKEKPTQPLMEYAIHNLLSRLSGGLTPTTELVRFEVNGQAYPVLISKTMKGKTLKEQLPNDLDNEQWVKWSWLLIASILTRPGDGRLSNFIFNKGYISCVDNEISFVEPIIKGKISSQIYFCSALFCLFQNKPLDQKVIDEFCDLDSNLILEAWIEDVIQKEKEYRNLFFPDELSSLYKEDPYNKFKTTILFRQGTLATLNMQFVYLQNQFKQLVQQKIAITPIKLLEKLIVLTESPFIDETPGRTIAKSYVGAAQPSIEGKLIGITSRKEDKSLTSLQSDQACLGKIPTFDEIYKLQLFTPLKAKEELYLSFLQKNDDFFKTGAKGGKGFLQANFLGIKDGDKPDLERQRNSLLSLIGLKNMYHELPVSITLQNCAALNSATLISFLHAGIEYLDLSFCPQIKNGDIKTIQEKCPKLKELHLTGCSGLTSIQGGRVLSDFLEFRNLKIIYLDRCLKLKNIRLKSPCLHYINGSHNPELNYVETNTYIFTSLEVNFDKCPKALDRNEFKGRFRTSYGNIHLNTCSIEYVKDLSPELCDDREFMVQAIHEDGPSILKFTSERLRNDKDLILLAIENSRYKSTGRMSSSVIPSVQALEFASTTLKNDKDVVLLAIGKSAGTALEFASDNLKNNKEIVKEALYAANEDFPYSFYESGTIAPQIFKFISESLKNDPKIIAIYKERKTKPKEKIYTNQLEKKLATEDPFKESPPKKILSPGHLTNADEALKNNPHYVLASVSHYPDEFQYAHDNLKRNIPFVQKVIEELPNLMNTKLGREYWEGFHDRISREKVLFGNENFQCVAFLKFALDGEYFKNSTPILKYASYNVRNDFATAYFAVQSNLLSIELLDEKFRDYDKFMLKCICICPEAFKFASSRLKKDKAFILKAITRATYGDMIIQEKGNNVCCFMMKSSLLAYAHESILDDDEVINSAIEKCTNELQFASERIKNDKYIVLAAVKKDYSALKFASNKLRGDIDFVKPIITQIGEALEYVSDELKNNSALVIEAVKQNGLAIRFASENLRNLLIVQAVKQNALALEYGGEKAKKTKSLIEMAVYENPYTLQYACNELKNDPEIVLIAVKQKGLTLQYASDELKNNLEIVLEAIGQDADALEFASNTLKNNADVVLAAVSESGLALEFASDALKNDKNIVLTAIKEDPGALEFASKNLKNNLFIVLEAVKLAGLAVQFANDNLKNNNIVGLTAIKNGYECFEYLGNSCKDDREIVIEALFKANEYNEGEIIFEKISERLKNDPEIISIYKERKTKHISSLSQNSEENSSDEDSQTMQEENNLSRFSHELLKGNSDSIRQLVQEAPYLLEILDTSDSEETEYQQWISDIDYWEGPEDLKARNNVFLMQENLECFSFIECTEYFRLPFKDSIPIFKNANQIIKSDPKISLEAFCSNIGCLQFADDSLKDSEYFMLECIHNCAEAFRFASERLKRDKGFVLIAIEKASYGWLLVRHNHVGNNKKFIMRCSILAYVQEIFGDDEEIVTAAAKKFNSEINFASERMKSRINLLSDPSKKDLILDLIRGNI